MDLTTIYCEWWNRTHGLELEPNVNHGHRATTENGILYHAELLFLLDIRRTLGLVDAKIFSATVSSLGEGLPLGLFNRGKGEHLQPPTRTISHDNMTGIIVGCELIGDSVTIESIVDYGFSHFGIYNNTERKFVAPTHPANIAPWFALVEDDYSKFFPTRNKLMSLSAMPLYVVNLFISMNRAKDVTSGKKLYLLQLYSLRKKPRFNILYRKFCSKMVDVYGDDFIHQIYSIYYKNPNHPLRLLSKGIKYDKQTGRFTVTK